MGRTGTENGGVEQRQKYGTLDLHCLLYTSPSRWIYTRSGTGWSLGLGGGGFRGRDSGVGTGVGVTMPLGGRPPISYNVLFENGKVVSWEAVKGF